MRDIPPVAAPRRDRLHGRRRGRRLRPGQQKLLVESLPRIRLTIDELREAGPRGVFPAAPRQVWLEIGFGGGEHLAEQASAHGDVGVIGCEVFQTGIVSLLHHIGAQALDNVRVVTDDARLVLDALPDASIARAFILFPDPWPKARHHKRRLVSPATMDDLARVLEDGAELRLATDDVAYLRVMLAVACAHPAFEWTARGPSDWRARPPDWPATRYEAKAIAQGRPPAFLRLVRRPRAVGAAGPAPIA